MTLRSAILTAIALLCFAGNSLICKAALGRGLIGPAEFTFIRILTGSIALLAISRASGRPDSRRSGSWASSAALFAYAGLFSLAYLKLDAGMGALILFGFVQVTMIGWSISRSHRVPPVTWIGGTIALSGLALLTVPGKSAPSFPGLILMAFAGVSWGIYSLRGKGSLSPLQDTALNFTRATPFAFAFLAVGVASGMHLTSAGLTLACLSGIVTSGFGYSIWYAVVPGLGPVRAGIVQLLVPPIALIASVLFLGEGLTLRMITATALILAGVGTVLVSKK